MIENDDKRNYFRMLINALCQVKIVDQPSTSGLRAICKDISASGMSLELGVKSIDPGTLVEVTIHSQNEQISALEAKAKVIRCETTDEDKCIIGVEISEMN